jgi:hypothetical protein
MLRPIEIEAELLGQPLPWDLFDRYGVLLLARGATLTDPAQVSRLNARRLFARAEDLGDLAVSEIRSPFAALAELASALERTPAWAGWRSRAAHPTVRATAWRAR